jgi:hypothetical protein
MPEKTEMESFTSEYAMSGADNALSRKRINHSILAQTASHADALTNETEHRKAMETENENIKNRN